MTVMVARYQEEGAGNWNWAIVNAGLYALDAQGLDTPAFLAKYADLRDADSERIDALKGEALDETQLSVLSPITAPCRILCQGSNYPSSRRDTGMDPNDRSFNTLFHKSDASLCAPDADIVCPEHVQLLDYEVELGVVMGAQLRDTCEITPETMHQYVAGVVLAHDVTARDIQIPQVQFFKGKSYRSFCPTGPYLCLLGKDDFKQLDNFELTLSVNGELCQQDVSANMLFKPHETLSELSSISDLDPGDVLLTGSPGGGALKAPPAVVQKLMGLLPDAIKWQLFVKKQKQNPHYLKSGDRIEASIRTRDGKIDLGIQRNRIR